MRCGVCDMKAAAPKVGQEGESVVECWLGDQGPPHFRPLPVSTAASAIPHLHFVLIHTRFGL
jgi:hypothetical protein